MVFRIVFRHLCQGSLTVGGDKLACHTLLWLLKVSERGLAGWTMLQAYQNKLHGHGRVRVDHMTGVRVVAASKFGLNFVVPSTTAYFVDFGDEGSGGR